MCIFHAWAKSQNQSTPCVSSGSCVPGDFGQEDRPNCQRPMRYSLPARLLLKTWGRGSPAHPDRRGQGLNRNPEYPMVCWGGVRGFSVKTFLQHQNEFFLVRPLCVEGQSTSPHQAFPSSPVDTLFVHIFLPCIEQFCPCFMLLKLNKFSFKNAIKGQYLPQFQQPL